MVRGEFAAIEQAPGEVFQPEGAFRLGRPGEPVEPEGPLRVARRTPERAEVEFRHDLGVGLAGLDQAVQSSSPVADLLVDQTTIEKMELRRQSTAHGDALAGGPSRATAQDVEGRR